MSQKTLKEIQESTHFEDETIDFYNPSLKWRNSIEGHRAQRYERLAGCVGFIIVVLIMVIMALAVFFYHNPLSTIH